jgi:hypothetical protein
LLIRFQLFAMPFRRHLRRADGFSPPRLISLFADMSFSLRIFIYAMIAIADADDAHACAARKCAR